MNGAILLVGFGNMGRALANGWLERGMDARSIHVVDPDPRSAAAAQQLGLTMAVGGLAKIDPRLQPSFVVLAVKPAQLQATLEECKARRLNGAVFVSIAAGKRLAAIGAVLGDAPAIRAMPNTPAAIGAGMTVLTANAQVSPAQRADAEELMSAIGKVEWLDDESLMDAVTAVSGSGPAYVFLLIESLVAAGVKVGLDADLSRRLATATVAGAGAYAARADCEAAELRRRVTSPGGTTEAALEVLVGEGGFPILVERAVHAATQRGRALSSE